jgi:hypothetical protein
MVTMIGRSHHFFRTRMNAHNSEVMLEPLMNHVSLKLMFDSTALSVLVGLPGPEAFSGRGMPDGIPVEEAHDSARRRKDQEVQDAHEHCW